MKPTKGARTIHPLCRGEDATVTLLL